MIATINFSAKKGLEDSLNKALERSKGANGECESFMFFYGDLGGLNDYRYPIFFTAPSPENMPSLQAQAIFEEIKNINI